MSASNFSLVPQLVIPVEPDFATIITQSEGMNKQYQSLSNIATQRYELTFKGLSTSDFWTIYNHYYECLGGYDSFSWTTVPSYLKSYMTTPNSNITYIFSGLNQTTREWSHIRASQNGNVYACVHDGDIYMQAGGSGDFVALGQTTRYWYGMTTNPVSGDVYACVTGGDIYMQAGGSGDFVALSQTSRSWNGMAATETGDVYACVYDGDIYKQTGGSGDFVALSQASRSWHGICVDPNGDIYACAYGGDIYKYIINSMTGRWVEGSFRPTPVGGNRWNVSIMFEKAI